MPEPPPLPPRRPVPRGVETIAAFRAERLARRQVRRDAAPAGVAGPVSGGAHSPSLAETREEEPAALAAPVAPAAGDAVDTLPEPPGMTAAAVPPHPAAPEPAEPEAPPEEPQGSDGAPPPAVPPGPVAALAPVREEALGQEAAGEPPAQPDAAQEEPAQRMPVADETAPEKPTSAETASVETLPEDSVSEEPLPEAAAPPPALAAPSGAAGTEPHRGPMLGFGPGITLRLQQLGFQSIDELVKADPQQLKEALGDLGQLIDINAWVDSARRMRG